MAKDHFLLLPAKSTKSCEKIIFSREFVDFAGRQKENSTLLSMSESLYTWWLATKGQRGRGRRGTDKGTKGHDSRKKDIRCTRPQISLWSRWDSPQNAFGNDSPKSTLSLGRAFLFWCFPPTQRVANNPVERTDFNAVACLNFLRFATVGGSSDTGAAHLGVSLLNNICKSNISTP